MYVCLIWNLFTTAYDIKASLQLIKNESVPIEPACLEDHFKLSYALQTGE